LSSPAGAWSLTAGVALSIAVTSLFRALELGPASVVVPIYGMFVVGGFILGVVLLGETITFPKAVGLVAAKPASISYPLEIPQTHVRFGSLADIRARVWDIGFTPQSRQGSHGHLCPLCARSRHWLPVDTATRR
jgi:hypothetical protein